MRYITLESARSILPCTRGRESVRLMALPLPMTQPSGSTEPTAPQTGRLTHQHAAISLAARHQAPVAAGGLCVLMGLVTLCSAVSSRPAQAPAQTAACTSLQCMVPAAVVNKRLGNLMIILAFAVSAALSDYRRSTLAAVSH